MPPAERSPAAKLAPRPRPLSITTNGSGHYSTHEGVRAQLAPSLPSIGTCPLAFVVRPGDTSGAHSVLRQVQLRDAGQAQTQGCRVARQCACATTLVVPATDDSQEQIPGAARVPSFSLSCLTASRTSSRGQLVVNLVRTLDLHLLNSWPLRLLAAPNSYTSAVLVTCSL